MPANTSGSLTTTLGSVNLAKSPKDTMTQIQLSGTYGSVSGVIEGSIDGGQKYFPLGVINNSTQQLVANGAISPADNATVCFDVESAGMTNVQFRSTAVGSGTVNVFLQSDSYIGLPPIASPTSTPTPTFTNGITAFAGGGQGSAVALTSNWNRITTVASGNDSVKLPAATAGVTPIVVENAAASNSANVFPSSGDAINALSANAAFALAANKRVIFYCIVTGTWSAVLTA